MNGAIGIETVGFGAVDRCEDVKRVSLLIEICAKSIRSVKSTNP